MEYAKSFIELCKKSFIQLHSEKKLYRTIDELQADVDEWIKEYNEERTHTGKYCFGKTPIQTFLDSIKLAKEKRIR